MTHDIDIPLPPKQHIDQYHWGEDKPFRRINAPFDSFSGVYKHTHDNGYVVTSPPHNDGECLWSVRTCNGQHSESRSQ